MYFHRINITFTTPPAPHEPTECDIDTLTGNGFCVVAYRSGIAKDSEQRRWGYKHIATSTLLVQSGRESQGLKMSLALQLLAEAGYTLLKAEVANAQRGDETFYNKNIGIRLDTKPDGRTAKLPPDKKWTY